MLLLQICNEQPRIRAPFRILGLPFLISSKMLSRKLGSLEKSAVFFCMNVFNFASRSRTSTIQQIPIWLAKRALMPKASASPELSCNCWRVIMSAASSLRIARTQCSWESQRVSLGLTTLSYGKFRTPWISLRVSPFLGE